MDIRKIVTGGLSILAGILATEATAEQRVPPNEEIRIEMVSYNPAEESDNIRRSAIVQRIEILERYEEHELKRLSLLDQMQRLQERNPEYPVRTISSIQSEKEMFVNSTSRYSVDELTERLARINIDLDSLRRAQDQISLDNGSYLLSLTLDIRDQRPRRAKKVEANEGAFLEYQRMFDENERLVELTERRTQEAIRDIETRDNTTFEQIFAQYGENWQELLPTNIRIQTNALEDRREALRSRFIAYFGEAPEKVIGAKNGSSHYIHPQKVSEFLAELIRTDVHDNHERVLTSIGNERYKDQLEARAREDSLITRLIDQDGVIFLDDRQKQDYQTQIDSATRNEKIRFIGEVGGLWGYGLERVTDQEAREIAVARGIAPVLPETVVENTTRNKGVTPQGNNLTIQEEETTVIVYDTHLTEQQILELIQGFEGKVYGTHTIKAEDLELTLWNTFAAVGVLHEVDAMGKRSNENLRYEILNHGENPEILGSSYGRHGDNSTKNTKALKNLLAGKIDLNLTDNQIYDSMQRLSQLNNPNEIEKIAMLLLSREVDSRNLEQTLAESIRERENILATNLNYETPSFGLSLLPELSPNQIDYNEKMGNVLSNYERRGSGSIDQVVEAVNHSRARGNVVSRFNKKALESSGDIGMAYNIIGDQELTYDQRIEALESSIGMSASRSTIGRLKGEAENYIQLAAEEEAEETLTPNERVSVTQLVQIVEEKAEEATRATPTTYSSLGKRAA